MHDKSKAQGCKRDGQTPLSSLFKHWASNNAGQHKICIAGRDFCKQGYICSKREIYDSVIHFSARACDAIYVEYLQGGSGRAKMKLCVAFPSSFSYTVYSVLD